MKIISNKGFKCFQFKNWPYSYYFTKKSMIKRWQLYLLFFDNNLFENNIEKFFRPNEPSKSLKFLYL